MYNILYLRVLYIRMLDAAVGTMGQKVDVYSYYPPPIDKLLQSFGNSLQ